MALSPRLHSSTIPRGFALPMTVIAIAGLMTMLIGLLSMVTMERKTANSYSHAARAEMAIESGLAEAIATLSPIVSRDDTIIFRLDDPDTPLIAATASHAEREQFFTFGALYDTTKNSWRILPFASGLTELSAGTHNIDASTIQHHLRNFSTETLATLGANDRQVPRATWVDVPTANSAYTMRYAWWVEDLSGRIDGANAGSAPRVFGESPSEIGLFTIFTPTAETDTAGPEDLVIAQRQHLRSAASVRLLLDETEAKKIEPYLTYQLPQSSVPRPLIPHGFGYKDAGQPAKNLTELIEQKDVDQIAAHIDHNLPQFDQRKGGFPTTEHYSKTIAASIIDYADADHEATIGNGYRGVDSFPFVNELFDRYVWIHTSSTEVTIRVSTYAELWNPTNQTISGRCELENVNLHTIRIPPAAEHRFSAVKHPPQQMTIPPNGFVVRLCGTHDYTFPIGAFPPSMLDFPNTTVNSSYRLHWNGTVVDWARGGAQRTSGTLGAGNSNAKWKGSSSPAHDHSLGQHGDPRASYYINTPIFANNYDGNSNWGGRVLKPTVNNPNYREVKITLWPDRGSESSTGTVAGTDTRLPTSLVLPANQPTMAPAFIANRPMLSLGEIGNVFDPAQWSLVERLGGSPSSRAGGGFTLAIGRPEYAVFDREGQRAAQLLDLFYLTPSSSVPQTSRINLNTAPREVLRTLVAGQSLSNDPTQATLYPPRDSIVGDRFADAVIATRNLAPLRGLSDLALIRKNPAVARNYTNPIADTEPFFGNPLQYSTASRPDNTWDDAGREELFQRVTNLVTFHSKTFRIVVSGQILDKSGTIIGRRNREFTIRIEPPRDTNGNIEPNQPLRIQTLMERSL